MSRAAKSYNAACLGMICGVTGLSVSGLVPSTYQVGWVYGFIDRLVMATWFWKVVKAS